MSRRSSAGAAIPTVAALALVASALFFESVSGADEVTIVGAPPHSTVAVMEPLPAPDTFKAHYETRAPNLVMIGGGIITLGVSYGIAAIAGATSSRRGDGRLFVPVLGPWLDFADRGGCGTGSTTCDLERGNKIGLVVDGVFQGIGVLAIVGGFVFRGKREGTTSAVVTASTLQFVPVQYARGGMGFAAIGSF
jgi:hypothetical protein